MVDMDPMDIGDSFATGDKEMDLHAQDFMDYLHKSKLTAVLTSRTSIMRTQNMRD
jgi:hypothetical protein